MKRVLKILPVLLVIAGMGTSLHAQELPAQAFENVTIHRADGSTIESGTIVWREGVIEALGRDVEIPFDSFVIDGGDSLHVYPGFIDGFAEWSSPEAREWEETPQYRGSPTMERAGIRPERMAREVLTMDSDNLAAALQNGLTTGNMAIRGYMVPGQTDLFFVKEEIAPGDLFEGGVGMQIQFEESDNVFPGTVMGVVARLHQLWNDARAHRDWQTYYASNSSELAPPDHEPQLEAIYPVMDGEQQVYFKVDSKEMIERVFKLQDELGFDPVIISGTEAWKVADELSSRNIPVLASIDFPDEPDWRSEEEESAEEELTDFDRQFRDKQWNAYLERIQNVRTLMDSGVRVGFASAGMDLGDFGDHLQTWLEHGDVSPEEILQILTVNTAEILNQPNMLGTMRNGRVASFSVMDAPFTEEDAQTLYSVSEGSLADFNE